jgi:hypothetical protein
MDSRVMRRVRRFGRAAGMAGALGLVAITVGCQVEYAGMTLPSGKYMYDDVQYFPPGPAFPWANTQAATQRARMQAMGIDPNAAPIGPATAPFGGQTPAPMTDFGDPRLRAPEGGMPADAPGVPSPPAPFDQPPRDAVPEPGGAAPGVGNAPAGNVPPPPEPDTGAPGPGY